VKRKEIKYALSVSYGNDSIALIQWAHERKLKGVVVVYCDTGMAHPKWKKRIKKGEKLAQKYGFKTIRLKPEKPFEEWVTAKQMFPYSGGQWCSLKLKIEPFELWLNELDSERRVTIVLGKRRVESRARAGLSEKTQNQKYYSGREIWNPLYKHTDAERDELIKRAGFKVLPHRSLECCPCVNANKADLRMVPKERIDAIRRLEKKTGKTMFRPRKHMGAKGIDEIIKWAHSEHGKYRKPEGVK
jgi:3'-phosphoadenosine 5'-phosphosulfate sulfotransferase (PAPS reductase)/FAD synthetase